MRVKINPEEIKIGEPLNWNLYNDSGNCMFRKGFIVYSEQSRLRLLQMELYIDSAADTTSTPQPVSHNGTPRAQLKTSTSNPESKPRSHFISEEVTPRRRKVRYEFDLPQSELKELVEGNVFLFLDYCIAQEKWICDSIIKGQQDMLQHINVLADNLLSLFKQGTDACLGAIHLEYEQPYSCCHPVYSALLCLLIAEGLGISEQRKAALLRAALTANLGMYEYHDRLVNMNAKLSDEEFAVLKTHPEISHRMLMANGVTDSLWLEIVMQHHERGDGSGYPKGLKRSEIHPEAAVLATVDTYLAFVMPRAYRKPVAPKVAMQKIYKTAVAADDTLSLGLIKQLGVYPPGSLVRLATQEIAVVVDRNNEHTLAPWVACVGVLNGKSYPEPVRRSTESDVYKIIDSYISEQAVEIDMNQLWKVELVFNFRTVA